MVGNKRISIIKSNSNAAKEFKNGITGHALFEAVLEKTQKHLDRIIPNGEQNPNEWHFPPGEEYEVDVSIALARLISLPEELRLILHQIRSAPPKLIIKEFRMTRPQYIQHHFKHFLLTVPTLIDAACVLAAAVLNLGLEAKDVRPSELKKNIWLRRWKLDQSIKDLEKLLEHHKQPRNEIAHQAVAPGHEFLDSISQIEFIYQQANLEDVAKAERRRMLTQSVEELTRELICEISFIEGWMYTYLDKLLLPYQEIQSMPSLWRSRETTKVRDDNKKKKRKG